jgi:hypothetical protein
VIETKVELLGASGLDINRYFKGYFGTQSGFRVVVFYASRFPGAFVVEKP